MKKIVLALSVFCFLISSQIPEKHQLTLKVEGITQLEGNLGILLFNTAAGYPENNKNALKSYSIKVDSKTMVIELGEFPKGEYAITLMQDKNLNGIMDKSMIGIPKEPFGFSVLKEIPFGAPSFKETSFKLEKDEEQVITLLEI